MQDRSALRIGCVKYLNARPLIWGWKGEVVFDDPTTLCRQLSEGALDVAFVSSFEFLQNPIYSIVHGISISSNGPVYSVVVAHRHDLRSIKEIALDPASTTSANLLRILLPEFGLNARLVSKSKSVTTPPEAQLLIGDQAIRFRRDHPEFSFWDLGTAWKEKFDVPFVYALWLIRPEIADKAISGQLRSLRDHNLDNLESLITAEKDFDHDFCSRYYREYLRFEFGEPEKEGLRRFNDLCAKHGLVPSRPLSLSLA